MTINTEDLKAFYAGTPREHIAAAERLGREPVADYRDKFARGWHLPEMRKRLAAEGGHELLVRVTSQLA